MGKHPAPDEEERLERASAPNDETGWVVSWNENAGNLDPDLRDLMGRV